MQLTGPASPTAVMLTVDGGTNATAYADAGAVAFSSAVTAFGTLGAATTNFVLPIEASISATTAGNVALQLAANGAGTLTVQPGKLLQVAVIDVLNWRKPNPMRQIAVFLLALFLLSPECEATRLIFLVTSSGTVAGIDSRDYVPGHTSGRPHTFQKSVLIQGRIVIAVLGLGKVDGSDYQFGALVGAVTRRLPENASVTDVADATEAESKRVIATLNHLGPSWLNGLHALFAKQGKPSTAPVLIDYPIFGYENATPLIYDIVIAFDMQQNVVIGPKRLRNELQPGLGQAQTAGLCSNVRKLKTKFPKEMLASVAYEDLPMKQGAAVVAFVLSQESKCDRLSVGPPYVVYSISKSGPATYERHEK